MSKPALVDFLHVNLNETNLQLNIYDYDINSLGQHEQCALSYYLNQHIINLNKKILTLDEKQIDYLIMNTKINNKTFKNGIFNVIYESIFSRIIKMDCQKEQKIEAQLDIREFEKINNLGLLLRMHSIGFAYFDKTLNVLMKNLNNIKIKNLVHLENEYQQINNSILDIIWGNLNEQQKYAFFTEAKEKQINCILDDYLICQYIKQQEVKFVAQEKMIISQNIKSINCEKKKQKI